jgi:hypothetical protein
MIASTTIAAYTPCSGRADQAAMSSMTRSVIRDTVSVEIDAPTPRRRGR